ncbi:MAG: hypothetical protein ACI8S6_000952 [Myxococcota bacterium]|jgi:hypothetical protein
MPGFTPAATSQALLGRLSGGLLIALGGTLWGMRSVEDPDIRQTTVRANAACDVALAVVLLAATAGGTLPWTGWVLVGLFAVNAASWMMVRQ